jgi:hypothetical protein
MKKVLRSIMEVFGYCSLLVAPWIVIFGLSTITPFTMWSRMGNETEEHYQQRMQLQALAFRLRCRL